MKMTDKNNVLDRECNIKTLDTIDTKILLKLKTKIWNIIT